MKAFELLCYWTGFIIFVCGGISACGWVAWRCLAKFLDYVGAYGTAFQIACDYFSRKRKEKDSK